MSTCDDVLTGVLLRGALDTTAAAHVQSCARCRDTEPVVRALRHTLASDVVDAPPAALGERVLRAAAPLLATNAGRVSWSAVLRPIAAALVPLPLVLLIDVYLVSTLYDVLRSLLPDALSTYLVINYTALLALLLTLAYGAIPLLADRQVRLQRQEIHG